MFELKLIAPIAETITTPFGGEANVGSASMILSSSYNADCWLRICRRATIPQNPSSRTCLSGCARVFGRVRVCALMPRRLVQRGNNSARVLQAWAFECSGGVGRAAALELLRDAAESGCQLAQIALAVSERAFHASALVRAPWFEWSGLGRSGLGWGPRWKGGGATASAMIGWRRAHSLALGRGSMSMTLVWAYADVGSARYEFCRVACGG